MIYHSDGFTNGPGNPCPSGGGFTVCTDKGEHLITEMLPYNITNNEAELIGMIWAIWHAKTGDTIVTDSTTVFYWIRKGKSKARPDLNEVLLPACKRVYENAIKVVWKPREENQAGIYNEYKKPKYIPGETLVRLQQPSR